MIQFLDKNMAKIIKKQLLKKFIKTCADCTSNMKVFLYSDKSYRGGHYFGKIGFCSKKEEEKARKSGSKKFSWLGHTFYTWNYEAKPYKHLEHWECPKCYWRHYRSQMYNFK